MMRLKIALRNILRNRRRTILNLTMIAGGFSAIVLFQGFAAQMLEQLTSTATNNQFGHIQVAKNNFWNQKADESAKQRAIDNPQEIISKLSKIPGVEYASGRITFYALLSTGDQTISAQFIGFDPKVEKRMQQGLRIVEGKNFNELDLSTFPVMGGQGLIRKLNAKVGQDLTILSNTFDGVINAVDVKLAGIFLTTITEVDDSTIYMTLETAQRLLDTQSVERLVVLVNNEKKIDKIKNEMTPALPKDFLVRGWKELATLFRQVEDFYSV
jgi:putative ABC transport system permease protein